MQNLTLEPFHLVGISVRTTNENGQAAQEIGAMWEKFLSENLLDSIPDKVDSTIYSVYTEYEGDHTMPYTAILGCRVNSLENVPNGMVGKTIPGGNYVKTSAKGDLTQGLIVNEWHGIWDVDLDRAYTTDFEAFGEKARNPNDAEVDFYLAVK